MSWSRYLWPMLLSCACGDVAPLPPTAPSAPSAPSTWVALPPAAPTTVDVSKLPSRESLPVLGPSLFQLSLALEDQDGRALDLASLTHDGPTIVTMFYASCDYACPTLIRDVVAIDERLSPEARAKTRIVLVTIDPERDTPAVMTRLREGHGVAEPRWTFARAKGEEPTRELAAAIGLTYRRLPDGNYNHSSILLALDASGQQRARIDGLKQDATAFVTTLELLARP